jgi:uncharacterized protein
VTRHLRPSPCILVALCAACALVRPGPDRSRYFVLTPIAHVERDGREPRRELAVGLGPTTFPPYLDRSELVSRVGTNELRPSPFDFWAGSLNEQFKSALGQNLALMIGPCRVTTYPWYAGTFDATVGIDVLRFEVSTDGSAHLVARWAIRDGRGTTVGDVRESNLSAPVVGRDAGDAVAALSKILTEFSRELATAIRAATEQRSG